MKYCVRSLVMIEVEVEVEVEDSLDIYEVAGDRAGDAVALILNDADVDFEFCDDWQVYDQNGCGVEAQA
jgi:hypothetical protein